MLKTKNILKTCQGVVIRPNEALISRFWYLFQKKRKASNDQKVLLNYLTKDFVAMLVK